MDELEAIRKKKLEALKQQSSDSAQQVSEEQQLQQQVAQLEAVVKQAFTKEALERYGNVKAAYPEKAMQIVVVLAQAVQTGQIKQIDDQTFKSILQKLTPKKKDIKIKRV